MILPSFFFLYPLKSTRPADLLLGSKGCWNMRQMSCAPWARAGTGGHRKKAPPPPTIQTTYKGDRVGIVRALAAGLWHLLLPALRAMDFNLLFSPLWGA